MADEKALSDEEQPEERDETEEQTEVEAHGPIVGKPSGHQGLPIVGPT